MNNEPILELAGLQILKQTEIKDGVACEYMIVQSDDYLHPDGEESRIKVWWDSEFAASLRHVIGVNHLSNASNDLLELLIKECNNETHETHEDRVKILEGAPDVNAELYIDGAGKYVSISTEGRFTYKKLDSGYNIQYGSSLVGLRSLSDIQQLVDMQNEVNKWHDAYLVAMNEFDKKCKALNKVSSQCRDMQNEIDELKEIKNKFVHLMRSSEFKELVYNNPDFLDRLKGNE